MVERLLEVPGRRVSEADRTDVTGFTPVTGILISRAYAALLRTQKAN